MEHTGVKIKVLNGHWLSDKKFSMYVLHSTLARWIKFVNGVQCTGELCCVCIKTKVLL